MEILFAQLIVSPATTEQRQVDVALSLFVERQTRKQQLPFFTSCGLTRPRFERTTSRLWGGRSTDWANTPVHNIIMNICTCSVFRVCFMCLFFVGIQ